MIRAMKLGVVVSALYLTVAVTSCTTSEVRDGTQLTLLAYDSFTVPDGAFESFTAETGIEVEIAIGGDAGELVAKAALSAGNPEGDVLWGVDNSLLDRLVEAEALVPFVSTAAPIPSSLIASSRGSATPVDFGFVCVNYDIDALRRLRVEPPTSLEDLTRPEYRSLLVVPDATSSSPGFAFLLATVAAFPDTWAEYWQDLMNNDAAVAAGWTDAYYTRFSRHGGDRPLVVSYSTSPPAEVLFSDPPMPEGAPAPTGVATGTCFQQIEYAGILNGSRNVEAAKRLVDFMVGRSFQELLPESLFVFPANSRARLPESFERHVTPISRWLTMDPRDISRRRVELLDEWTRITGP